ncbi:MAG: tyrosine recombinase XerD, partial [Flavobacteriia bacterium]|nr:tyrosine recombinase XerD [Flavobacteriia bacterium]
MDWPLALKQFVQYLRLERGRSANTLKAYQQDLEQLHAWAQEQNLRPASMPQEALRHFLQSQAKAGKSPRTQAR